MSINPLALSKLKQIMGPEAVESMLGAQFNVTCSHEMLSQMIPKEVHDKLHGSVKEDFMEEAICCSYCLEKMIQYLFAKSKGQAEMLAIRHKWAQRKMEATR
jgi:redox-regulated HSP33 family molecular chaperone